MNRRIWLTSLLMAVMSIGIASASEVSIASLHQLLALSGIDQQVRDIPRQLRVGMEQAERRAEQQAKAANDKAVISHEFRAAGQAMTSAFNPADMLRAIGKQVRHNMSEQDVRTMLAWFRSPLGRRINKAEEDASTPAADRRMFASAKKLLADKPRVRFARKLDELLHLTDTMMEFQENMAVASFVAFAGAARPGHPVAVRAFRAKVAAKFQQARPRFAQFTILHSVYTYQHINMANLRKYLAFLKAPPALRFNKCVIAGLDTSARQAMAKLTKGVGPVGQSAHPSGAYRRRPQNLGSHGIDSPGRIG